MAPKAETLEQLADNVALMVSSGMLCNLAGCLAADVVAKSNSGHPGAPMGMAPMAHTLFSR